MSEISCQKAMTFKSDKELFDFYSEFGYVSIKNCIPENLVSDLQKDLNNYFVSVGGDMGNDFDSICINMDQKDKPRLYEMYKMGSNITAFKKISKPLSEIINKINLCDDAVLEMHIAYLIGLPKDMRLTYDWHQESSWDTDDVKRIKNMVNVHYPIFRESNILNGSMSVLVGSHKLGPLEGVMMKASENGLSSLVPHNIESILKQYQEVYFDLGLGDCVFFHKDLIHKSNCNNSKLCRAIGTSRLFQVTN